jgi:hypothetical protein
MSLKSISDYIAAKTTSSTPAAFGKKVNTPSFADFMKHQTKAKDSKPNPAYQPLDEDGNVLETLADFLFDADKKKMRVKLKPGTLAIPAEAPESNPESKPASASETPISKGQTVTSAMESVE